MSAEQDKQTAYAGWRLYETEKLTTASLRQQLAAAQEENSRLRSALTLTVATFLEPGGSDEHASGDLTKPIGENLHEPNAKQNA